MVAKDQTATLNSSAEDVAMVRKTIATSTVVEDPGAILSTNSAEDVAMIRKAIAAEDVAQVRKTIATLTVIDDPGDPDVMLPDLRMSSSSGSSVEGNNNINSVNKRDDESTMHTREGVDIRDEDDDIKSVEGNVQLGSTHHARNTTARPRGEDRSVFTQEQEQSSAHTRTTTHTRGSTHTRETNFTRETTQTKQTSKTQETFQTFHTEGDESQFTFQTFATTGCETIGDASVEMKNALIYIQESVGNCLGVDIASEVKASMGEVEQKTAEIVGDRKEIWHVLLDQVEDQMIEQLGDHWLEQGDSESKRRARSSSRAASSSSARRRKKGGGHRSKERRSSRERGSRERNGRTRSKSRNQRDETRDDVVMGNVMVDDDEVESAMLSEIKTAGSEDSPVGERSVLYFAA